MSSQAERYEVLSFLLAPESEDSLCDLLLCFRFACFFFSSVSSLGEEYRRAYKSVCVNLDAGGGVSLGTDPNGGCNSPLLGSKMIIYPQQYQKPCATAPQKVW